MRQPNLFSSSAESGSALTARGAYPAGENRDDDAVSSGPPRPFRNSAPTLLKPRKRRLWVTALLLAEFLLAITVRIFIGVIVLVLPWSPLWDNNHLLQAFPHLATLLSYGATRGVFSGVGLMNLWIAVDDTLHRDERHV